MNQTPPVIMTDLDYLPADMTSDAVLCCITDSAGIEQKLSRSEIQVFLSADERRRLTSITNTAAKKRFILGRSFIRHVLSFYLNRSAGNIIFQYNRHGKPYQSHDKRLTFNLSHTADQFALALSTVGEVGIDIERHKPGRNIQAIADEILTSEEQNWFAVLSKQEQTVQFYRLWTLKEATLKSEGTGLDIPIRSFGFNRDQSVCNWNDLLGSSSSWQWSHNLTKNIDVALALKTLEGKNHPH